MQRPLELGVRTLRQCLPLCRFCSRQRPCLFAPRSPVALTTIPSTSRAICATLEQYSKNHQSRPKSHALGCSGKNRDGAASPDVFRAPTCRAETMQVDAPMHRWHEDVATHFSCLVGTNSTIPPLVRAGRERCTSVPLHRHVPRLVRHIQGTANWAQGCMARKTEIRKPLPHTNAGASN